MLMAMLCIVLFWLCYELVIHALHLPYPSRSFIGTGISLPLPGASDVHVTVKDVDNIDQTTTNTAEATFTNMD